MINAQLVLYIAAAVVLLLGAVLDHPRFNTIRCIALGMALIVLAQIIK